ADAPAPTRRAHRDAAEPAREWPHADAVAPAERHVAERGGHALRGLELRGLAHRERCARVDEEIEAEIFLRDEEPQHELFEPRVGVPVDAPNVVAARIRAM